MLCKNNGELRQWKGHSFYKLLFIYLFGVLRHFQHCTGHITTGRKGRGNQYIEVVRVLYCKLPTNGKQLPVFPLEAVPGTEPRPQRWEARVLPLCHRGPFKKLLMSNNNKVGVKIPITKAFKPFFSYFTSTRLVHCHNI